MNSLELEVQKIRSASSAIASGIHLIDRPAGPFDLTAYDLRQSENALRAAADQIADIRIRAERHEFEQFRQRIKEATARIAQEQPNF